MGQHETGTHDAKAQIISLLQAQGQRLTPQRLLIIELLIERGDHVTADEIYTSAFQRYPFLNVSTVYRTLEMLRDSGIVSETDLGDGRRHFALLSGDLHHHAICLECGGVVNVEDRLFASLRRDLETEYGFTARIDHIALFGVCRECVLAGEQGGKG
jgi:Fur family transcriptional regulator, ferric uptake regulator